MIMSIGMTPTLNNLETLGLEVVVGLRRGFRLHSTKRVG